MSPFDLVEALIRCGERRQGRSAARRLRADARLRLGGGRARALPGARRQAGLRGAVRESRAVFASIGFAFEAARTDLYLGETPAPQRRRGEAREPLARALAAVRAAGRRRRGPGVPVRVCARRAPLTRARTRRTAHGALSERERQVAVAAAAGRTNREIAAELFLSPRTVELHLAAAFRKLGIRRRTELAQRGRPGRRAGSYVGQTRRFPYFGRRERRHSVAP